MTDFTPILHIAQVAPGQADKETTINTAVAILEAAGNDSIVISAASGDVTLTEDQFTKNMLLRFTGHAVGRTIWIPDTPRFFVVSNEGTGTLTVKPNGSASGSVAVPASKIALISTDGDTIRMVSSGASLLTDLSDVDVVGDPPSSGDVLKFDGTNWVPGAFSSSSFLGLTDTPSAYTSQGSKLVRVNSGATAVEFVAPATNILGDFPSYSALTAGRILAVNLTGTGLEYISPSDAGLITMASITDVEISSGLEDGAVLTYNEAGGIFEFLAPTGGGGSTTFLDLTDTPANYTGAALKYVRVNAGGTGVEFVTLPMIPQTLGQLSDVETGTGPQDGDILRYIDGVWQPDTFPGIISLPIGSIVGKPANAELISRIVMVDTCYIAVNCPGSQAKAGVASAGNVDFDVKKNGASVATVTFNTSATGTFTAASPITLVPGDVISLVAPATQDANLEDISITLRAKRS